MNALGARSLVAWLSLLPVVLASSGCHSKEDAGPPVAASTVPPATRGNEGPRRGGYVVLPSNEPTVLNPILQVTFDLATPLVFDGLIGLDANLEPLPRLAEKWEISPDGRELTFHLRRNVTWHDDKPFTADDVVFTVERIRSEKEPTVWRGYFVSVESVTAPDPYTVKIRYKEPYGAALASFTFGIIPKHLFDGKPLADAPANRAPVGTGPFRFTRWTPGRQILLEANPTYFGGRPHLDKVELLLNIPASEQLAALRDGKLDFASIVRPEDFRGVAQTPEFRARYETATLDETTFVVLAWNCQKKPLDDRRVRKALAHAFDRPRVIEDVLLGGARPISGPFFPTMWGADPSIPPLPFDLGRARTLLAEAGVKALPLEVIALETRRGPTFDAMAAIFRNDLAAAGVDLRIRLLPPGEFVQRLVLRDFDAALFEWVADVADPDPFALLHSSQIGEGANYAGYANPEVDRLLEEGRRSQDRAARKKAYHALHRLVHEDQPYLFLYSPQSHYAWSRRLRNASPLDVGALPRYPGVARWWVIE